MQYYENNNWESYYINEVKNIITNIWEKRYKNITDISQSSDNLEDDILTHIFRKRKMNHRDELKSYLRDPVISNKTDILLWWKVSIIKDIYCNNLFF